MLEDLGEQLQRCAVLQCAIEILMAKGDGRASVEVAQEIRRLCKDLGNRSKEAGTRARVHCGVRRTRS